MREHFNVHMGDLTTDELIDLLAKPGRDEKLASELYEQFRALPREGVERTTVRGSFGFNHRIQRAGLVSAVRLYALQRLETVEEIMTSHLVEVAS